MKRPTKLKTRSNDQHQFKKCYLPVMLILLISITSSFGQIAFPGAEGYGANSIGGRGGQVIKVTNLDDNGLGSFREAVMTLGPRIVVFEVSGIINLESDLFILNPNITIAGQTSPGGILITGRRTKINTHDVIIQHIRFRVGSHQIANGADAEKLDALNIVGKRWGSNEAYNIIIDHCSISWGVNENLSITGGVTNATVQWCIISEGLSNAGHPDGEHSKGLMISGKYEFPNSVSIHHNYIAQNTTRTPLIYSPDDVETVVDGVNNITYNWKGGLSPTTDGLPKVNWVHNFAKQGKQSHSYSYEFRHSPSGTPTQQFYVEGNIGSTRLSQSEPHWNVGLSWRNELLPTAWQRTSPWPAPPVNTTEMSYDYALEILADVGATAPVRDAVDARVIADFAAGTGDIIDNVTYPDDFPTFQDLPALLDTDDDGMPDTWETTIGLNPLEADNNTPMISGYTAIEEYLNELTGTASGTPAISLTANTIGSGSVDLSQSGPYAGGEVVTLNAIPDTGWQFDGWSGDLS